MRGLPTALALAACAALAPGASAQTFHAACTDGLGDTASLATAIDACAHASSIPPGTRAW